MCERVISVERNGYSGLEVKLSRDISRTTAGFDVLSCFFVIAIMSLPSGYFALAVTSASFVCDAALAGACLLADSLAESGLVHKIDDIKQALNL